jgi:predicted alpha/beta hydrolase family esterase
VKQQDGKPLGQLQEHGNCAQQSDQTLPADWLHWLWLQICHQPQPHVLIGHELLPVSVAHVMLEVLPSQYVAASAGEEVSSMAAPAALSVMAPLPAAPNRDRRE